ncbi:MAG: [NiFe]-hydrogenase assembly chaperone HybE [Methylocystis sp.]|uniref:[NiFe]-hydrogenase assembly chaperone HybE n=1 Tax=Methylocystis sp. TaxID=1911079 RepID=UPI003DA69E04
MDDAAARVVGARLAELYARIWAGPMRDVPICNEALGVEAVGFRAYGDAAIGIVVTPWFMNLVVVDASGQASQIRSGAVVSVKLPAGEVDCVGGWLDDFGPLRSCSLFSPMFEFSDMAFARDVAVEAMTAFFTQPAQEEAPRDSVGLDRRALLGGRLSREKEARP